MPNYFCHQCSRSFDLEVAATDLTCPRCNGGFVEIINRLQPEHQLAEFVNHYANDYLGDLVNPGRENEPNRLASEQFRRQLDNLNAQLQQARQAGAQAAQNARNAAQNAPGNAPNAPNAPEDDDIEVVEMFLNDPPQRRQPIETELQALLAEGIPRILNDIRARAQPPRPQAAPAPAPAPPRQRRNPPAEPRVRGPGDPPVTLSDYLSDLFTTMRQPLENPTPPPTNQRPAGFEFSVQFGGGPLNSDGAPPLAETMNNLLAQMVDRGGGDIRDLRGYNEEEIGRYLPMKKVNQKQVDNGAQCTTCFDTFKLDDDVGSLDCNHIFHRPCIIPWLLTKMSCPVCRQRVNVGKWKKSYDKKAKKAQEDSILQDLD